MSPLGSPGRPNSRSGEAERPSLHSFSIGAMALWLLRVSVWKALIQEALKGSVPSWPAPYPVQAPVGLTPPTLGAGGAEYLGGGW